MSQEAVATLGSFHGRIEIDLDGIAAARVQARAIGKDVDPFDVLELEIAGLRETLIEEMKARMRRAT